MHCPTKSNLEKWPNHVTTMGAAGQFTVNRWPERPAITFEDTTLTYAELGNAISQLAGGLRDIGVREGDRVALMMINSPEFILTYMASVYMGATIVPVPSLLGPEEAAYILKDSGAHFFAVGQRLSEVGRAASELAGTVRDLIVCSDEPGPGAVTYSELFDRGKPITDPVMVDPATAAEIVYTSGTTGRPKGALLTHRNLMANASQCRNAIGVDHEDIFVTVLPFFHSFGATVSMLLPLFAGSHNVVFPKFSALHALRAIETHRATVVAGVPTMFALMLNLKKAPEYDLSSLRFAISGGAALPDEVCIGFQKVHGVPLLEGYGPTEASPVVTVNPLGGRRKVGSAGLPLPGVEVMIADEQMNQLPAGEVGEICVRGANIMVGYHNDARQTSETIVDGWLRTGDLGRLDDDNYLYIVDRKKDLIIVGGINVYPREVEDCIARIPEVAEVAVVGTHSELRGEVVTAYIVLQEDAVLDAQTIITHCRQHLAPYKVPKQIKFADTLVKSAIGKVLKHQLKNNASAR